MSRRSYDRARPAPLVISLHGAALWGAAQREISQWNAVADREGLHRRLSVGHERQRTESLARGR